MIGSSTSTDRDHENNATWWGLIGFVNRKFEMVNQNNFHTADKYLLARVNSILIDNQYDAKAL